MGDLSDAIKTTFENIQNVYRDTSNLLGDTDSMLEKMGYYCIHPNRNTIGTERSYHIDWPNEWITPYACRYFSSDENPTEAKAVGVFYTDADVKPIEPIIIMACFKMKRRENEEIMTHQNWYLKETWFNLVEKHIMDTDLDALNIPNGWHFEAAKVRAISIEEVHDQKTLEEKIVNPLIAMSC